jgi:uncharacterized protein (DUF697 family)
MELVKKYAVACAIVGLFPLSGFILMIIECAMVYHLSVHYRRPFNAGELIIIWAILGFVSFVLFVVVGGIFDVSVPIIGWIAKAAFAFGFVMLFGKFMCSYYETENAKTRH